MARPYLIAVIGKSIRDPGDPPSPEALRAAELVGANVAGAGAILLLALGRNPITFYSNVWKGGIELTAWQDSAIRAAPLLLIAVGLVVVFRANIWNLGYNGQFLLGAALISGLGPHLVATEPRWLALLLLFLVAGGAGAAWTLLPALLKARYETNEIITTLMMSFIGVGVANILIKLGLDSSDEDHRRVLAVLRFLGQGQT